MSPDNHPNGQGVPSKRKKKIKKKRAVSQTAGVKLRALDSQKALLSIQNEDGAVLHDPASALNNYGLDDGLPEPHDSVI